MKLIEATANEIKLEDNQSETAKIIIFLMTLAGIIFFTILLYSGEDVSYAIIFLLVFPFWGLIASIFSTKTTVTCDKVKGELNLSTLSIFASKTSYFPITQIREIHFEFLGSWDVPLWYSTKIALENGKMISLNRTHDRIKQYAAASKLANFLNVPLKERERFLPFGF